MAALHCSTDTIMERHVRRTDKEEGQATIANKVALAHVTLIIKQH